MKKLKALYDNELALQLLEMLEKNLKEATYLKSGLCAYIKYQLPRQDEDVSQNDKIILLDYVTRNRPLAGPHYLHDYAPSLSMYYWPLRMITPRLAWIASEVIRLKMLIELNT